MSRRSDTALHGLHDLDLRDALGLAGAVGVPTGLHATGWWPVEHAGIVGTTVVSCRRVIICG
jgi:hypothetical protein